MSYRNYNDSDNSSDKPTLPALPTTGQVVMGGIGMLATGAGLFALARFRTAHANEVLVRSGWLISQSEGIQVGRTFVQWPFQHVKSITLEYDNFETDLNAMSDEKMPFKCPANFTIGPINHQEALKRYAMRMGQQTEENYTAIIHGIIDGETRALAASLTMEKIFEGRGDFKNAIVKAISEPLEKLGLEVVNANLKELTDGPGSNYFKELAKKIQAGASNTARIDVSEEEKRGTIGATNREKETRVSVAQMEADAKTQENARSQEVLVSNAQLEKTRAEQHLISQQAKITAEANAQTLQATTQRTIQALLLETETERQRADRLSKMRVDAEVLVRKAEGDARSIELAANAQLHRTKQDASGVQARMEAEASGSLAKMQAEAAGTLAKMQAEAEGNLLIATSKATGVRLELEAQAKGQHDLLTAQAKGYEQLQSVMTPDLLNYIGIDRKVFTDIAASQADAVRGMAPNVTVIGSTGDSATNTIRSFIPTMKALTDGTGFTVPDWLLQKTDNQTSTDIAKLIK